MSVYKGAFKSYIDKHYKHGRFKHLTPSQVAKWWSDRAAHWKTSRTQWATPRVFRKFLWTPILDEERRRRIEHAKYMSSKWASRMASLPYGHPLKQAARRNLAIDRRKSVVQRTFDDMDRAIHRHRNPNAYISHRRRVDGELSDLE